MLDQRPVFLPNRVPVHAVEGRVVEIVGQGPPTLLEHLGEFFIAANGDFRPVGDDRAFAGADAQGAELAVAVAEVNGVGEALGPLDLLRSGETVGYARY